VGLVQKVSRLGQFWFGNHRFDDPHSSVNRLRTCRFEEIEPRNLMTADLHVGSVYYEQAAGNDAKPNLLQFTFEGGATGTQLTQIVIDGDKTGKGLSSGDVFFDTAPGGLGSFASNPLKIVSHDGFQVVSTQVVDGGTRLVINFSGFDAGETLVLSVDVDEAQFVDPATGETDTNAVAEGGEFQRSHFTASFVALHYEDVSTSTLYWDDFDKNFAAFDTSTGSHLNLPPDRYLPNDDRSDLTAGAVASTMQIPLPDSIAGVVFADANLNNHQEPSDPGIGGVKLSLYLFDGTQYLPTGATTVTDANGNYKFDKLPPGQYRVLETQPAGYFRIGAAPGTIDGVARGVVTTTSPATARTRPTRLRWPARQSSCSTLRATSSPPR
jgi:SdrD B-like protein